ncbi:hypothetical protein OS190_10705 [Sulfitobacter sp. F26204]|nr:hypothetical protein [Sulfitobacter sp. F26204]MCX7560037.1 hypothetical protein [Sulfitobacter sp. F26204]
MTNLIAFILGILLVGAIAVDWAFYGTEHMIFLGKKMLELIEWVAFWR